MTPNRVQDEQQYLAELIEAIQRCAFFLDASIGKLTWPLTKASLENNKKNVSLFETLSSINERFSKLQDTLGAAMRHGAMLAGEPSETFLRVLSFYEKIGVIESIESWQLCRTTRNLAAHNYGVDYLEIADHFNTLHELVPTLYLSARRFVRYCCESLSVVPVADDFVESFKCVTERIHPHKS